jgi:predicted metal-dependent hydrolase
MADGRTLVLRSRGTQAMVAELDGVPSTVLRVQGTRLKSKREIRVASLFKEAPAPFLKMIVVHELAHLKEREHDKPFYALCCHMESDYHQLEFDLRLWLTAQDIEPRAPQDAS